MENSETYQMHNQHLPITFKMAPDEVGPAIITDKPCKIILTTSGNNAGDVNETLDKEGKVSDGSDEGDDEDDEDGELDEKKCQALLKASSHLSNTNDLI